jgi:hypothetical protein
MRGDPPGFSPTHFAIHIRHLVDDENASCEGEACRVTRTLKEEYLRQGLFEAYPRLGDLLDRILRLPSGDLLRDRAVNEMPVLLSRMRLGLPSPRTPPSGRRTPGVRAARRMAQRLLAGARRNGPGRRRWSAANRY